MAPPEHTIETPSEQPLYPPLTLTFDDVPWTTSRQSLRLLQPEAFSRLASHFSRLTREFFKQSPPNSQPPAPGPASTPETSQSQPQSEPIPEPPPEPLVIFTRSDFKSYILALREAFKYTPGLWNQFLKITNDLVAAHNKSPDQPTPSPA